MDGAEIVEMYYNDVISSVLTPTRQLCGFKKVFIKAGETVRVALPLRADDLSLVNIDEQRVLEPGDFEIYVGGGLHDLKMAKLKVE